MLVADGLYVKTVRDARSSGNSASSGADRVGSNGAVGEPMDGRTSGVGFGLTGLTVSDTALRDPAVGSTGV